MEKVKNESKNVHNKRALFFHIGLVVSLLLCFVAFEFKVHIPEDETVDIVTDGFTEIISDKIQPTVHKPKPKPQIPTKKAAVINITEDKAAIAIEELDDKPSIDQDDIDDLMKDFGPGVEPVVDPTIHDFVESKPSFEGGMSKFYDYVSEQIDYPNRERKMGIEGKVFLVFVIEVDGSITDVQVLKPVSDGIDAEAIRVLESSPKWNPGTNRGQPVRVRMRLPINFQLQ